MSRYRLTKYAERELIEIAHYVSEDASIEIAEGLVTQILDSIILLGTYPDIGRAEESYGRGIRSFPSRKFRIYYRKRRGGILVLHIFHAARDQKTAWKKRH